MRGAEEAEFGGTDRVGYGKRRIDLPIVLMSGFSHQEAAACFDGQALAGFLQKPFRVERLREIVRDAISQPGEPRRASRAMTAGA